MIKHIFHIIRQNKITSILLFILLSAASLVTVLSVGGLIDKVQYFFLPRGYTTKNLSIIYVESKNKDAVADSLYNIELYNRLKSSPYMEKVACGTPNLIYNYNKISLKGKNDTIFSAYPREGDELMADIMGIRMLHGRWLQSSDYNTKNIVVTPEMANLLFNEENVSGKSFDFKEEKYTIVGVCNSIRQNKQDNFSPSFFSYKKPEGSFTLRIKKGEEQAFSNSIESMLANIYGINNYIIYYETLQHQDHRVNGYIYATLFRFVFSRIFMLLVALFSFVAVIWYTTERRRQEWSIRYVIGRNKNQIINYIFWENLLILLPAFVFSLVILLIIRYFQVETFSTQHTFFAIGIVCLFMLIFLWIGILIPSNKIKKLNISDQLKSE